MKKASLSLSINAIVVLVLAIVIMAFALPFIQKMFKSTTAEFEALTGEEPSAAAANGANPITLSRNNLIMNLGDKKAIKASVFNNENQEEKDVEIEIKCIDNAISKIKESKPTIGPGKSAEVILIVSASEINTDICTFTSLTNSISIPVTVR